MKNLFLKLFAFFPILILLCGVNYFVDSGHLFKSGVYENQILKILQQGKNAANVYNYDERLFQKIYIEQQKIPKDVVIFGSSRMMMVGNNIFKNKTVFNSSVSAASLNDYIAIYSLYRKHKLLPKTLVLGLDPSLLNANSIDERFQILKKDYNDLLPKISSDEEQIVNTKNYYDIFSQLLSLSLFQVSYKYFFENFAASQETDQLFGPFNIKRTDGTLAYDQKTRNRTLDEVNHMALHQVNTVPVSGVHNYYGLDEKLKNKFEKLVALAKSDKVDIILFLTPHHPLAYDFFISDAMHGDYKIIRAVEDYFVQYAKAHNIPIVGSYSPYALGLKGDDFYDGWHQKESAVEKYFKIHEELETFATKVK